MRSLVCIFLLSVISYQAVGQIVFGQRRNNTSTELGVNYSSPQEFEIAGIEVSGVEFLDNNALISLSGLKIGDVIKIPGDEITSAIESLWEQGIIGNANIVASKIEGNQIWLTIELEERPRLTRYNFEGVNGTDKSELEDQVELVRGKILTDVVIKNTEIAVKKYLESKGYLNAKVDVVQAQDTVVRNSAILNIKVEKGKKVKIRAIEFTGNDQFPDVKLRTKMKETGEYGKLDLPSTMLATSVKLLNPVNTAHFLTHKDTATFDEFKDKLGNHLKLNIFKDAKYVIDEYESDKQLVIDFYNSKGFRDAQITSDSVYAMNDKFLKINLKVDEGQKYYFRDIHWTGNFIYPDETLDRILAIEKGDVYNLELIDKKLNYDPTGIDISSLYMDNGYLFFNVNPVEVGIQDDSIDVEMRIYEGAQATINEVTIVGNDKTNDHVIRRELRTLPGQKFSRAELIRTQRELSQLGYFDPQKVNPVPKPNMANETVDIEWQLEEKPNDQIELSGGWGGFYGFVGTLGVSFNNFSIQQALGLKAFPPVGDGQRLSVRAQANGRSYQSYSVSFQEPWLGGKKPNSFGISYTYSVQRIFPFTARGRNDFSKVQSLLNVSGVTLTLGRRVKWPDDYFTVSNSLGYLKYDLFQWPQGLGFDTGTANSVTLNTTISRRSSDSPMYPKRGSDITLSVNMTPPYSLFNNIDYETASDQQIYKWMEYHKWNFDLNYYLNFVDKFVLAPRMHFGFIGSYNDRVPVGPFERFVLGGSGLTGQNFLLGTDLIGLRGYPDPRRSSGQANSVTPYDGERNIFGGTMFTKFVMELRYPVSLSPTATIYALGFVEGGNNWNDFSKYNPYDIKRSAGVGVRIFMPAFGLLGLDYGYGFDAPFGGLEPAGSQFHFSIGQQIR